MCHTTLTRLLLVILVAFSGAAFGLAQGDLQTFTATATDTYTVDATQHQQTPTAQCSHLYAGDQGEAWQNQLDRLTQTRRTAYNNIQLLPEGGDDLNRRFALMDQAQDHIHLYTLAIGNDETGKETVSRLVAKHLQGVQVNSIDYWLAQAMYSDPALITFMRNVAPNAQGQVMNVQEFVNVNSQGTGFLYIGSHKKLLLVDSATYGLEGIIGGRNIADHYFLDVQTPQGKFANRWRDTDVYLRGPVLYDLAEDMIATVDELAAVSHEGFAIRCAGGREDCRYFPDVRVTREPQSIARPAGCLANRCASDIYANASLRLLENEPGQNIFAINQVMQSLLAQARQQFEFETPYFIPQPPLLSGLKNAARRGVAVRLLTSSRRNNDNGAAYFAASLYSWPQLLQSGMNIFTWDVPPTEDEAHRNLHSKYLVVDQCLAVPASWNWDGRSFSGENEYALLVEHPDFAAVSHAMLEADFAEPDTVHNDAHWLRENVRLADWVKAWVSSNLINIIPGL